MLRFILKVNMHKRLCAQKIQKVLVDKGLIDPQADPKALGMLEVKEDVTSLLAAQGVTPQDIREHQFGGLTMDGKQGFLAIDAIVAAANAPAASQGTAIRKKPPGKGRS